jgi:hypothetical protein
VFEKRVLRRIFGPRRDEVTGGWRKLRKNLYPSPSIIRMIRSRIMRWARHVVRIREKKNACRLFEGKPEEKIPLGSPKRR